MAIKIPFLPAFVPSKTAQAVVAFLAAVTATGTYALHQFAGFLPNNWAVAVASVLSVIAAVAGFIKDAEPVIGELDGTVT